MFQKTRKNYFYDIFETILSVTIKPESLPLPTANKTVHKFKTQALNAPDYSS